MNLFNEYPVLEDLLLHFTQFIQIHYTSYASIQNVNDEEFYSYYFNLVRKYYDLDLSAIFAKEIIKVLEYRVYELRYDDRTV